MGLSVPLFSTPASASTPREPAAIAQRGHRAPRHNATDTQEEGSAPGSEPSLSLFSDQFQVCGKTAQTVRRVPGIPPATRPRHQHPARACTWSQPPTRNRRVVTTDVSAQAGSGFALSVYLAESVPPGRGRPGSGGHCPPSRLATSGNAFLFSLNYSGVIA